MKRFTETEKWRNPWFLSLSNKHRILWLWLCDRVDNSGVVDIYWPLCSAESGYEMSAEDISYLGDKVNKMENGKWHLPDFVSFQFGTLSEESRVHQSVIKLQKKHSLYDTLSHSLYHTPIDKDKDKDKDKEKEKDKMPSSSPKRQLTDFWCERFKEVLNAPYKFNGVIDGKAADELIKLGLSKEDILSVAEKAWLNRGGFWSKQAITLAGLSSKFNQIREEVGALNGTAKKQSLKDDPFWKT